MAKKRTFDIKRIKARAEIPPSDRLRPVHVTEHSERGERKGGGRGKRRHAHTDEDKEKEKVEWKTNPLEENNQIRMK